MIHHVYANQSNAGDWLSARGIQALLQPYPVQEHFCDAPFVPKTLAALQDAGRGDLIIIGGGGLFMDYFVPFWEGFRPLAERLPFVIWGAGCCDMKREQTRPSFSLISEMVDRSHLCVVRDDLTRDLIQSRQSPRVVACPTVIAVSSRGGGQKRLLHVDHYDNVGPAIYEHMVATAGRFAERTGRDYRQTNNLIPAGHNGALQKTLDLYASAELVLTSRLHGCIIALAMGRRVLAVSADRKVESFMSAAGLADWVCDLDDVGGLGAKLEQLERQRMPVEFVENSRRANRQVSEEVCALARAIGSEKGAV